MLSLLVLGESHSLVGPHNCSSGHSPRGVSARLLTPQPGIEVLTIRYCLSVDSLGKGGSERDAMLMPLTWVSGLVR